MLREIWHFVRHMPGVARLAIGRSRVELFELLVERADEGGMADLRRRLVADLSGRILEIGCGTGRMFRYYSAGVQVTAIEPDAAFRAKAEERAAEASVPIVVTGDSGEALPFPAEHFDAVVLASVLCSVGDVDEVLSEVVRVLRPQGVVRLLEHVRSERPLAGFLMSCANPLWRLYGGCHMSRRLEGPLQRAGLQVEHDEAFQLFIEGLPAFPSRFLRARPAGASTSRELPG